MPRASVKRVIYCDKNQLIDLVLDIENYPDFVPYCIDAKVYEKKDSDDFVKIIADLTIGKGPLKDTYKSDVKFNKKNNSIYVTNIDGPLKYLDNKWTFEDHKEGAEIYFEVDFEIKNKFLNILMTTSFQYGLNKIADAFQERANNLFNKH
jgi:coenzyme Q-binding protein COQ10